MAEADFKLEVPSSKSEDNAVADQRVKFCQPCSRNGEETAATLFCCNCEEFQCTECSNGHKIYSFMKNHNLVDANTMHKLPIPYDRKGLDRCVKHDELVKFFCRYDKRLCCSTCAIIEHRHCNHVDEIKNISVDLVETEQSLKIKISKMKEKGEAAANCWTNGEKIMHEQLQNVLERFTKIRSSVNRKFDEVEKDLLVQGFSFSEIKAKEYDRSRLDCEGIVNELKQALDVLDDVKSFGTPEQKFIAQQRVNESLENIHVKTSDKWLCLKKNDISLKLNPKLEAILDSTEKLASLKINTSEVKIDSIVDGMPVKLKKKASIHLQKSEDETGNPLYSAMDFLPDGRLVAVDNKNDKCVIFSDQLEQLVSYTLSKPLGVVAMSEDEVAVTAGQKTYFLRVSKFNEIHKTKTIVTTSGHNCICLRDNAHFVVGVYNDTKPVRVMSFAGAEKHLDIDFPTENFAFGDSACTYIQNSDKVVLTHKKEHTVYIYYMKDNTRVIVKDDHIKEPMGVAIGPFDSIFVCSRGTNSIVQISQTGKILSCHKLNLKNPFRVCVSKDNSELAVSSSNCDKLQLFCLSI